MALDDPFADIDPGAYKAPFNDLEEIDKKMPATKTLDAGAMKLPNTDRPRLSSYANSGEFTPLVAVEGRELLIQSIEPMTTKYGDAFKVGAVEEGSGEIHTLCCGQTVVKSALQNVLEEADSEGREVQYPIPVRFVKGTTAEGNPCWRME